MFSRNEVIDLFKAWSAIAIAFTILYINSVGFSSLIPLFMVMLFTVGIGFLLHELSHKFLAIKYNCYTEFRADNKMLIFMIITSFLGIVIAAPGGVYISGLIDKKKNGLISLSGPVMNMILAILFLLATNYTGIELLRYGFIINSWLGLFNMLPFFGLDGLKVFRWNKLVYFIFLIIGFALTALSYSS